MVSRITRGYRFFRASYFMPVVVTSVATATIFVLFYTSNGPLNWWLRLIGLEHLIRPWLSDPNLVRFSVMFPEIWQFTGTYFIIHLAGVQSIPSDVIESAKIDGASSARILTRIIAPMMTEVIQVGILFSMVNAIKSFNFSWIMTGGGPGTQSAYVSVYMYRRIFMDFRYGYGSAMAVVILVALIVITVVFKSVFNSATKDNY
jgi:raffinose/stachyose/melibiose transport system permease protein